jgi:hypothetical protein
MTRFESSFVERKEAGTTEDTGLTELSQALERLEWVTITSQNCAIHAQEPLHG